MSILGVIPARYASTRFPGKPLAMIAGQPMIQHVYERVAQCGELSRVIAATDDERIADCVHGFGGEVVLTRADHPSGTDRLGEVAQAHAGYDYYINIQGDEPLISAAAIDALAAGTAAAGAEMGTLVRKLTLPADQPALDTPDVVKCAVGRDGYALYFSRHPVPYARRPEHAVYHKHIGIYIYTPAVLKRLCALPPSPLELAESLEQLRALEDGIRILAVATDYDPVGVDTPADVAAVEARLAAQ